MLTYGFYNSVGGDRKYDAEQIGAMFNGLITDGVFANYKNALKVTPGTGKRELVISSGRAWFNGTWTSVDDAGHSIYVMGSVVETTYFVYLAVDKANRRNSIAWYSSVQDNKPEKSLYFYLLAQVTIPGGVNTIEQSMITDTRGSNMCPYVTGILETVSFEEVVKEVCGENWQTWLDAYSAGLNDGLAAASAKADEALETAKEAKAYVFDNEDPEYTWAKYTAVETGSGSFEWGIDKSVSESDTAPPSRILFRTISITGSTAVLAIPPVTHRDTPLTADEQLSKWGQYRFFYGDGAYGQTDGTIYRYDALSKKTTGVGVGGSTISHDVYSYTVSKFIPIEAAKEPGEYLGTVTADTASAYPRNGYKDGYWYTRFAAKAEDVSFYYPGLSAKNVKDAIIEVVETGGNGPGTAMSVIEVEELPSIGAKGALYIVKKPGDSDASEYLWLDRWEKIGCTNSGENATQSGLTTEQINTLVAVVNAIDAFNVTNGQELIDNFNAAWGVSGGDTGGGDSGGEDSDGDESGGTTGDALPADGLMAYFDLRNATQEKVGTAYGIASPTIGTGSLYDWSSGAGFQESGDYGIKPERSSLTFDATGGTTKSDLGNEFTVISLSYGECMGPGIRATNIQPRWALKPTYNTSDGTATVTEIAASALNGDAMSDYNYAVYRVSGEDLTIINDTSRKDFVGSDYAGFVSWVSTLTTGGTYYKAGYGTAVAIYNRALSDVEIEEARAFMKTLEVTA